eukprot:1644824-Prymnesium_polylepis.1
MPIQLAGGGAESEKAVRFGGCAALVGRRCGAVWAGRAARLLAAVGGVGEREEASFGAFAQRATLACNRLL